MNERIDFDAAKVLISEYRKVRHFEEDDMLFGPAAFVMLLAAVALFAGLVALQFAASRARKRELRAWWLPIASLVAAIGFSAPNFIEAFSRHVLCGSLFRLRSRPCPVLLPAVVFTLVYVRQRRKMEMSRQLNKMNVQDL